MRQLKGRNMYNKIVSVILGLIQGVKDLIGTPEPTPKQAKHQTEVTKEVPSKKGLVASYNDWFDKANAKYYRDTFSLYAPVILILSILVDTFSSRIFPYAASFNES